VRQAGRRLSIRRRKWALRFFLLQVVGKRVKRDSCILQRKRVLQWLQEAVVGRRQVKRDPHRCCKRAADMLKR
jgi:hypothetical protein